MSDAWAESTAEKAPPDTSTGISMNQAFSVDVVFRLGWAAVQQQPQLALAVGVTLAVLQFGPQVFQQVAGPLAGAEELLVLVATLAGLLLSLVAWVYLQFCLSGSYLAFGAWVEGEEPNLAVVFTGGRSGVTVLLAMVLATLAAGALAVVLVGPGLGAVLAGALWMLDSEPSTLTLALVAAGGLWLLLAIPVMIYATLFLPLVPLAAALESVGPIDALTLAWERTEGARLTFFVLSLVFGFSQVLACCLGVVGLVPLLAVYHAGLAASWILANRPIEDVKKMAFFVEHAGDLVR